MFLNFLLWFLIFFSHFGRNFCFLLVILMVIWLMNVNFVLMCFFGGCRVYFLCLKIDGLLIVTNSIHFGQTSVEFRNFCTIFFVRFIVKFFFEWMRRILIEFWLAWEELRFILKWVIVDFVKMLFKALFINDWDFWFHLLPCHGIFRVLSTSGFSY